VTSKSTRHRLITAILVLCAALVVVAAVALFLVQRELAVPSVTRPSEVVFLQQNWTGVQRQHFYHTPQGSLLLPYKWFLALEQPRWSAQNRFFRDNSYLQGFGFIPDPPSDQNPDGLPVGFTRDDRIVDPYTGAKLDALGITCAVCHTGELFYRGKAIRIDAGSALTDFQKFSEALALALGWTYYQPDRFDRFAARVLGPDFNTANKAELRRSLKTYLDRSLPEFVATFRHLPTPEGYGRTDALCRIGNFVFGTELNNDKNLAVCDGPVHYPPAWDASWMDWVQYNGSIQQPMGRNIGEALGVRSSINLSADSQKRFQNTIRIDNIHSLEELLAGPEPGKGINSPKWPADIFDGIDPAKASQGQRLYRQLCADCHSPAVASEEGRAAKYWGAYSSSGKQFFKVTMVPLEVIGTDPKQARNFHDRFADTGPLGQGRLSAADGLTWITQAVIRQAYQQLNLSEQDQLEWDGYRVNQVRTPLAYRARPTNGIWATPPYLHNGSVPNLFELLSPVAERSRGFYVGSKEYDPVQVGLNPSPVDGASEFRVDRAGNSNRGHEFNDGPKGAGVIGRKLSPDERMQLIEYLKSL
jgi:hypothetical protein